MSIGDLSFSVSGSGYVFMILILIVFRCRNGLMRFDELDKADTEPSRAPALERNVLQSRLVRDKCLVTMLIVKTNVFR